jgi:hypothetical protein
MLRQANVSITAADVTQTPPTLLHTRLPLKLWMVSAIFGQDRQLVFAHIAGRNLGGEQVNSWLGQFGEVLATNEYQANESLVEERALSAEIGSEVDCVVKLVKAYVGVPLLIVIFGAIHRALLTTVSMLPPSALAKRSTCAMTTRRKQARSSAD